jgi:myo-inositol-1(or 4)-monophosphatase
MKQTTQPKTAKTITPTKALDSAVDAARAAGKLMRDNFRSVKKINEATQHDIKLELDVRCQKLIEKTLRRSFASVAILGEEGTLGDIESEFRWVIDPIDGTVNFTYGIPHACVSIALQRRIEKGLLSPTLSSRGGEGARRPTLGTTPRQRTEVSPSPPLEERAGEKRRLFPDLNYETIVGVVYDPFCDELWTARVGEAARLNGRRIQVSRRTKLEEAIVSIGFAKYTSSLRTMMPIFTELVPRVRKIRIMGAAALSLVYVATGRFDAYTETGVRLWDIAAGGLIIECAGGEFFREPVEGDHSYRLIANNGLLREKLEKLG